MKAENLDRLRKETFRAKNALQIRTSIFKNTACEVKFCRDMKKTDRALTLHIGQVTVQINFWSELNFEGLIR